MKDKKFEKLVKKYYPRYMELVRENGILNKTAERLIEESKKM